MTAYRFLQPVDVLFLRGNKLFGDPGSFGESLVPPWPSVVAGALRSRMLADAAIDLPAFARGKVQHPQLGTPESPGSFTVTGFHLARRAASGDCEPLMPLPADLVVSEGDDDTLTVRGLAPLDLDARGLMSSASLPLLPVLAEETRSKPASGYWLTADGWAAYCAGQAITPATGLVHSRQLWSLDARVGVGLDAGTRSVADGRLFSVQAVAMTQRQGASDFDTGFLVSVDGADLPTEGLLRLGGDGRAVSIHAVPNPPATATHADTMLAQQRCRLVLTSPGLFQAEGQGWLPVGTTRATDGSYRFDLHGVTGRLVAAAIPRAEVISGWDLARWQPKPALKAVPTGSVYWLDALEASPEALQTLTASGLWADPLSPDSRRAEGYNRLVIAPWQAVPWRGHPGRVT